MAGGVGASLASIGVGQQQEANKLLADSARQEEQRNAENKIAKSQAKQGNVALGSTVGSLAGGAIGAAAAGAEAGSVIGPWGTLIGGVLGALAGSLLS